MEQTFVLKSLINKFNEADYSLYAIGGFVRDLIFKQNTTNDIDLITHASIKEVKNILGHDFYSFEVNDIVKVKDNSNGTFIDIISIPENDLDNNLSQRDFVINSILYDFKTEKFLKIPNNFVPNRLDLIHSFYFMGNQTAIFRAIRITLQHEITMSFEMMNIIKNFKLTDINKPKVLQELMKILQLKNGLVTLAELGILEQIIPDFKLTYNFNQNNKHHDLNLFAHINLAVEQSSNTELKLAMLFHDLGKVYTAVPNKVDSNQTSFYGHELKSAEIAEQWLIEFEAPKELRQAVKDIILLHMSKTIKLRKLQDKVGSYVGALSLKGHKSDVKARLNINKEEVSKISQRCLEFNSLDRDTIEYNDSKPEMIILIGLPRSGKSLFKIKNYANYISISRDDIREREFDFKGNMDNEKLVTTLFNQELTESLNKGVNIIIDNTNIQRKYRRQFIQQARAHGYNIKAIVIDTDYEQVVKNAQKENFPMNVIESMRNRFTMPIMEEGYYVIEVFKTRFSDSGIEYIEVL